jgi:uncharacterized protein (DUF736 family)
MSTIGTFTKQDDTYTGTLRTLSLNVKCKIIPFAKSADAGPDYRILAGTIEIGAAWKRQAKASNTEYLSVKIDDPVFAAPVNAKLLHGVGGVSSLFWTR